MARPKKPKPTAPTEKETWYKVLDRGKSFHGGTLKWSLPAKDGTPGDWHQVEGDLVRCKNGLHLTDNPLALRPNNLARTVLCYEAEFEGDTIPPENHELVVRRCRLLRVIPWTEFGPSGAMQLLALVWKQEGVAMGNRSWRRLNDAMQTALALAITSGMDFDVEDFHRITTEFNANYWMHIEGAYARACGEWRSDHGPNPSAIAAIENYLSRKPFLVARHPTPNAPKDRLCVGKRFQWHENMTKQVDVEVTSFAAGSASLTACSYKERDAASTAYERKIDRRYTITHDDLATYHKAIRDHAKAQAQTLTQRDYARTCGDHPASLRAWLLENEGTDEQRCTPFDGSSGVHSHE
jgi:hypothetical protein